ncbi:MAG: hypothetical protein NXH97_14490 [Rhodobacteraceae bacterium]|nr:hypothetical protein [Paracoccaceae bacterium]
MHSTKPWPGMRAEQLPTASDERSETLQTAPSRRFELATVHARDTADMMARQMSAITGDLQGLTTPIGIVSAHSACAQDARKRGYLFLFSLRQWSDTVIAENADSAPSLRASRQARKDAVRDLRYVIGPEDDLGNVPNAFIDRLESKLDLQTSGGPAADAAEWVEGIRQ